ncbi:K02A2.6-like [Cordylochernes scorpioides]|uniref:RNA-directed DNA polymerase n=1 Tax=Cordylochernes scorpioides TaxID=51811 RepID=A0ABY6LT81_9ARAC|nr:K02A2.6-like [Cordylochernes scorpioides]
MLKMKITDPEWKDKIITGDETWVYGYDPETKRQSAEWRGQGIIRPPVLYRFTTGRKQRWSSYTLGRTEPNNNLQVRHMSSGHTVHTSSQPNFLINQEKSTTNAFRAVGPRQRGADCTSTTKIWSQRLPEKSRHEYLKPILLHVVQAIIIMVDRGRRLLLLRVPIPLMKQLKEQLEEMTRLGVIESVEEPTECTKNEWVWEEPQKKSFNLLKQELASRPNLALYNPSRLTIISADASSFGIGGVLRQEQPDGFLKPVAYVSRTLSETERRYSQIEKEGLAIVWTRDRLKYYVTGIKINIVTDHKPLIAIFTSKSLEDITPRLQRLKMRMMRYSYQISHIAVKKQIVADVLSRKPISKRHKDKLEEELSAYIQSIEFSATEERPLEISRKQKEDSLCSQVANYCTGGWPKNKKEVDPEIRGYWQFQDDLTYQNGLLLRGQRILIPMSMRKETLEKLHQGHFGINKCRSRAKESVWWLRISQEIERMVRRVQSA